jgi:hypothetical protein
MYDVTNYPKLSELETLWDNSERHRDLIDPITYHLFYVDYESEYTNQSREQIVNIYVDILMSNLVDKEYMKDYTLQDLESAILNWTEQEIGHYYKLYKSEGEQLKLITLEEFGVNQIAEIIHSKLKD